MCNQQQSADANRPEPVCAVLACLHHPHPHHGNHKHDHHRLSREEDENVPLRERVFLVRLLPGIRHKFSNINPLFSVLLALINCCTVTLVEELGTGASDAQVAL